MILCYVMLYYIILAYHIIIYYVTLYSIQYMVCNIEDPVQTSALLVVGRVAGCSPWGQHYWLVGHSSVFVAAGVILGQRLVALKWPVPGSPWQRQQRLAEQLMDALVAKTGGDGDLAMDSSAIADLFDVRTCNNDNNNNSNDNSCYYYYCSSSSSYYHL